MKSRLINLTEQQLKRLNELVAENYYLNVAEAIREAVKDLLFLHDKWYLPREEAFWWRRT